MRQPKTTPRFHSDSLEPRTLLSAALVSDLWPGAEGGLLDNEIVDVSGTLFFRAQSGPGEGRLWKLDGTAVAPVEVTPSLRDPRMLTAYNGSVFFVALDPAHGVELFRTDATGTSTTRLTDLWDGTSEDPESFPGFASITSVGGKLFFTTTRYRDVTLWTTDGTQRGTIRLANVGASSYSGGLTDLNGLILFSNDNNQLAVTDGTIAGTKVIGSYLPVTDQGPVYPDDMYLLTRAGDRVYYAQGLVGWESWLWSTDGTAAGTIKLQRGPNELEYDFGPAAALGNTFYYFSSHDGAPRQLWRTDGTIAGTELFSDLGDAWVYSNDLWSAGDRLYFQVATDGHDPDLWVTDGTSDGTRFVKVMTSEVPSWRYWNGRMYFVLDDVIGGDVPAATIWQTDGTEPGTLRVATFPAWSQHPAFYSLQADKLYLWADDGMWATDGGPDGVRQVHVIAASRNPNSLVSSNGTLFFTGNDGIHGMELWKMADDAPPFATVEAGVLNVRGTTAADVITVARRGAMLDATLNGQTLSFTRSSITRVQIDALAGNDIIDCSTLAILVSVNAGTGNDRVTGGKSADFLRGEGGKDTVYGGRGDDRIEGNAGNDYLIGGEGHDAIWAGTGDDRIEGNSGKDTLYGQAGNDALFGGSGNDRLDGGGGNDNLSGQAGADRMLGGDGRDRFFARDNIRDILDGGGGRDLAQVDLLDETAAIEQPLI